VLHRLPAMEKLRDRGMRLALLCLAADYMVLVADHVGMSTTLRTAERPTPNRGAGRS
jgi:hypothetical protein